MCIPRLITILAKRLIPTITAPVTTTQAHVSMVAIAITIGAGMGRVITAADTTQVTINQRLNR